MNRVSDALVTVETPRPAPSGAGATDPRADRSRPEIDDRATVLVVDDDRDVRDILGHYFTAKGYRVETAESADGLFGTLERANPDIVLLDLMLPGEDGRSVLNRLRASPSWGELPVIMITATHDTGALQRLRAGTDGWFEKPLDLRALLESVDRLIGHRHNGHQPSAG